MPELTPGLVSAVIMAVVLLASLTARGLPAGSMLRLGLIWFAIFAAGYVIFRILGYA